MNDDIWATRITLLHKIKDRYDDDAWQEFVKYYQRYIYNMLRRMRHTEADAEELCQKIIIKLWEKLPDFDFNQGTAKFRTWLCTVIINTVRNQIKHNKVVRKHREKTAQEHAEGRNLAITEADVEKIADEEWAIYIAKLAWENVKAELPEQYTQVFNCHIEGMNSEEISTKLDMKYNTVNVYKKRVKDQVLLEINRLKDQLF